MAHHEGHEGHEGKECMFPYSVGSRLPCGVLLHRGAQRCACAVACISTWQAACFEKRTGPPTLQKACP